MSSNPKVCPFLIQTKRQTIICKGVNEENQIHTAFADAKDLQEYSCRYCNRDYHRCYIAAPLNNIYKLIDDTPCPYNDGVECLHKDECKRCGWNPVVAAERLRKWMEIYGRTP